MIVDVWEVYKRDSQECVLYASKELADSQSVFDEVDLISPAKVDLSRNEIEELEAGRPVYCT